MAGIPADMRYACGGWASLSAIFKWPGILKCPASFIRRYACHAFTCVYPCVYDAHAFILKGPASAGMPADEGEQGRALGCMV